MYEPQTILTAIDDHTLTIMLLFGAAMVLQNIAMMTAVVMTEREGWISIPLPCTYLWFAHDLGVVARFDTWFNQYDHWFLKLFWAGIVVALLIEIIFLRQAMRVGRQEYLPDGTQRQWNVLVLGGLAIVVLGWEFQKTIWDDPLNQAVSSLTLYLIPLAVVPLILRRRSPVAQSPLIYGSFAAMAALWWAVTAGAYGEGFRSWQYLALGVVSVATLTALTWWIRTLRSRPAGVLPVHDGLPS